MESLAVFIIRRYTLPASLTLLLCYQVSSTVPVPKSSSSQATAPAFHLGYIFQRIECKTSTLTNYLQRPIQSTNNNNPLRSTSRPNSAICLRSLLVPRTGKCSNIRSTSLKTSIDYSNYQKQCRYRSKVVGCTLRNIYFLYCCNLLPFLTPLTVNRPYISAAYAALNEAKLRCR